MQVLLIGHRTGITKALEKLEIPYILWSEKPVKNKIKSLKTIVAEYPKTEEELREFFKGSFAVTDVIAGGEHAVIPASKVRRWLDVKRNSHSVILKCTDKLKMKKYLSEKGIVSTKFLPSKDHTAEEIVKELGLPVVCKVKLSSGGRGVEFLRTLEEVEKNLKRNVYFEKAIKGKEGSVESFIVDKKILFSSLTEYHLNGGCNKVPAVFSNKIKESLLELNSRVIESLHIKWGLTHLEYYLTKDGILFGEVALRPPGGYIMDTLELVYGQSFWELFVRVEVGLEGISFNQIKDHAASIIIHPGVGSVKRIIGLEKIKKLKSFKKIKIKLKVGDQIKVREGVGEDFGHAFLAHENQEQLNKDVDQFYKIFEIQMN
jgi:biotin carboxylase